MTPERSCESGDGDPTLVVRRIMAAPPESVFAAWTEPAQLLRWWGPRGVILGAAEMDLRVGGRYKLRNDFEDGSVLWIGGTFELIERPHRLVFSWAHEPVDHTTEQTRVTVQFKEHPQGTEVTVIHEGFRSGQSKRDNQIGWLACLDRLDAVLRKR